MASEFNVDIDNSSTVTNIIYGKSSRNDKVRGHSLTPRAYGSRSISPLIMSDSGDESYHDKVQWESNNMVENEPVAMSESLQLKYATPPRQAPSINKVTNTSSNTRQKHKQNIVPILNNYTVDANEDPALNNNSSPGNNIVNVQLNYDIN